MKKFLFIVAIVMMVASCNNRAEQNQAEETVTNEMTQDEATAEAANEAGQDGWMKQSTIKSAKPMVVDFYATWCGPCKELAPVLDEIEKNHTGEVIFKRIDVDQEQELAQEFGIQAIPTLMFITPKGEYQTLLGLQPAEVIEGKISELLKHSGK